MQLNEIDQETESKLDLKDVQLDQIVIANDYILKEVQDKVIKHVCLKKNQSVNERLSERLEESVKPHSET